MDDQIEVFGRHVAIGGVVTLFVLLAGSEGQAQAAGGGVDGGGGTRSAHRAHCAAGVKTVPVPARRFEAADFKVHRMRQFGNGDFRAAAHDVAERFIRREFPVDFDCRLRHAAARQWLGRKPRP
jgi:hypothetical protein